MPLEERFADERMTPAFFGTLLVAKKLECCAALLALTGCDAVVRGCRYFTSAVKKNHHQIVNKSLNIHLLNEKL